MVANARASATVGDAHDTAIADARAAATAGAGRASAAAPRWASRGDRRGRSRPERHRQGVVASWVTRSVGGWTYDANMCSQVIDGGSDGTRPLEILEREITSLASQIHAATCRWLCLVAEYDAREGWAQWACRSCAHWVSWQCGIAPGAAREHVRVARRLRELPLVREAFAAGELSYSKVRALTRVENVEREAESVELARCATASQLERLLRAYRGGWQPSARLRAAARRGGWWSSTTMTAACWCGAGSRPRRAPLSPPPSRPPRTSWPTGTVHRQRGFPPKRPPGPTNRSRTRGRAAARRNRCRT